MTADAAAVRRRPKDRKQQILAQARDLFLGLGYPNVSMAMIADRVGITAGGLYRVPAANLLGGAEGRGFGQLMTQLAQERLIIAVGAVAGMEAAVEHTVAYVKQREAFGQTRFDFQNTKFTLAECATTAHVGRCFVLSCIPISLAGPTRS